MFMKHNKSTLVYIIMAVPLKEGVAPFILQLFGTDNKFKTIDVIKRWNHTIELLKRYLESLYSTRSRRNTLTLCLNY